MRAPTAAPIAAPEIARVSLSLRIAIADSLLRPPLKTSRPRRGKATTELSPAPLPQPQALRVAVRELDADSIRLSVLFNEYHAYLFEGLADSANLVV
jgi:hypothetical protein